MIEKDGKVVFQKNLYHHYPSIPKKLFHFDIYLINQL